MLKATSGELFEAKKHSAAGLKWEPSTASDLCLNKINEAEEQL